MSTTEFIAATLEVVAFSGVAATIALTVTRYPLLPETVPIHFGVNGQINRWGPRGFVFLIPAIAVLFFIQATFFNPMFGFQMIDKHGVLLHPLIPMPSGVLSIAQLLFYSIQFEMLKSARTNSPLNVRFVWLNVAIVVGFVIASALMLIVPVGR
jgi:uncharacterized membrane protein